MSAGWKLEHTYAKLRDDFFQRIAPTPVATPELVILNRPLALSLGLNPKILSAQAAEIFSGNRLPDGADPIAQSYAGHQYGRFTILGDGRAILLGEQIDPQGRRWDIQLKGAGPTSYSRRGDGRAALGPMLREYLISEAMFALGISTTRSLAVVATGEPVFRETTLPGAVLTRIASSHIRVGTFEYAATRGLESVRELADHVIHRHYPELAEVPELQGPEQLYPALLCRVIEQQARLIAAWMNVGFVHGVMNTDNMTISGETIDYGPCAFMDHYDPGTVFSSIDHNGRYSFGNQPAIAHWNLTRFAETLLPLIHPDEKTAIESVHPILDRFASEFSDHWRKGMRSKLGLFESKPEDESLIDDLLQWMQKNKIDFTNAFRSLTLGHEILSSDPAAWKDWRTRWENRQSLEGRPSHEVRTLMQQSNPQLIPRNHHVEHALQAAVKQNDLKPFEALLEALQHPFENRSEHLPYLDPGPIDGEPYQTYCGT